MKALALLLAPMLLAVSVMASESSDEATIRGLETTWNEAHLRGDVDSLASLWAEDLSITVPGMEPMTKKSAIAFWKKVPVKFTSYTSDLSAVRIYGDTAVASGQVRRMRKFGERPEMEDAWYFTKVYRRGPGGWQVVAYHASEK